MSGLIKAEFKKLFKTRSLIVCSIIAIAIAAFSIYSMNMSYRTLTDNETMEMFISTMGEDMMDELIPMLMAGKDAMSLISSIIFSDSSIYIFIAICVSIFVASEYTMGTLKNTISRGFSKGQVYFSKALVSSVASVILAVVYIIGGTVSAFICAEAGESFNIGELLVEFLTYILIVIGLSMLFFMTAMIIKKTGVAIVVCLAAPTIINMIITMFARTAENIEDYTRFWLPNTFSIVKSSYSDGTIFIPILIAIGYIVLTYFIGSLVFSKRDIK